MSSRKDFLVLRLEHYANKRSEEEDAAAKAS